MTLQQQKIKDLQFIERQNNNPSFSWNGNAYVFNPSITEFSRELEAGGFRIYKLLTATVRLFNIDSNNTLIPIFNNGKPQPQHIITYNLDTTNYRIESIKFEKTGAYMRITAHSTTKIR